MNQRTCWRHQSEHSLQNMDSCGQCLAKVSDCSCNTKRNGCHRNWEKWTVLQKLILKKLHHWGTCISLMHYKNERCTYLCWTSPTWTQCMLCILEMQELVKHKHATAREDGIRQRAQLACHFKRWGNVHQCSCRIWQRIRSPECTTTSVSKHRLAHTLISYSNIAHNHRRTHIHVQRDCTDACTIHRWPFDTVNANVDQLFSKP